MHNTTFRLHGGSPAVNTRHIFTVDIALNIAILDISMSVTTQKQDRTAGFTLVELIISMLILGILSVAMVGAVTLWLGQYSTGTSRQKLTTNAQIALTRISDDIRKSYTLLAENSVSDPNAPSPPSKWVSSDARLVLGQTPRNSSGAGLYSDTVNYTGTPDSIVYYQSDGNLFRRIVPANYVGNVNLPIVTCGTSQTGGGCAADTKIASDVSLVRYTYLDKDNNTTTTASLTKAVKVELEITGQQAGQTITAKNSTTIALRTLN